MTVKKSDRKLISPKGGAGAPVPGPGRPKGMPNKLCREAKENIDMVYKALGDIKGHVDYLRKHPRALERFYSDVYPRLLGITIHQSGEVSHFLKFDFGSNGEGERE